MQARLDPERGAPIVQSAIETIAGVDGIDQAAALVRMAEIALAAVADTAQPARGLRGDERAAVIIATGSVPPTWPSADTGADGASRQASGEPRSARTRLHRTPRLVRTHTWPVGRGCRMRWYSG